VVKKYNSYANAAPACPRVNSTASDIVGQEEEYDHCKECQMGVFFKNKEEELECSYCSKIRKA
jgi:hypothetical protein